MSAPRGSSDDSSETAPDARARPAAAGTARGADTFVDVALHPRPPWDRPDQRAASPALYDPLTLLPNRSLLLDRLAMALSRTHRSGEPLAVVLCEVDGFDAFVAGQGQPTADVALRTIAKRLESSVRTCDTVGRGTGDEFILVCERLTHSDDIAVVLARVHETMREPVDMAGVPHRLTVSLGAVITNDPMLEFDELIDEAGDLLDAAREGGPGRSRLSDWSFQLFGDAAAALQHQRED
jgi:diguanylate cyclase (GGDEF)-like protein